MRMVGRVLTVISVVGLLLMPLLGWQAGAFPVLEWALGLTASAAALATPASWGLAVYHWGIHYPTGPGKKWWGLAVIAGMFVGGWIYWLFGAPKEADLGRVASA